MPFVSSIIIPHHGPQELLDRCVASIPHREDVEVIVVVDEDERGAGWARNKGLVQAQGEYVIFADSDDFFHPCFDEFLNYLKTETADVIYFNADSIELGTDKPSWRANNLNRIFASDNKVWQERHLRFHFTEPWCKAIKQSCIRECGIAFDESKILNDIYFSTMVGIYAKSIKVYNRKCYCVCNHADSTAKRKHDDDRMLDYTRETAKSNILLKRHGVRHHHSRMLRPLFFAIFHARFGVALHCWRILREEGYSTNMLLFYILRYPRDLVKLCMRKLQSGEIKIYNFLKL